MGLPFSYTFADATFTDADPTDTLNYTATQTDDSPLPQWLQFDAATRTFSGTSSAGNQGTVEIVVTATDDDGGSVSDSFGITVNTTAPSVPRGFIAVTNNVQTTLTWTAPARDGGSPITSYEYRNRPDGGDYPATWTPIPDSAPSSPNATTFTISSLSNATAYTFQLRAVNRVGAGTEATSATIILQITITAITTR